MPDNKEKFYIVVEIAAAGTRIEEAAVAAVRLADKLNSRVFLKFNDTRIPVWPQNLAADVVEWYREWNRRG